MKKAFQLLLCLLLSSGAAMAQPSTAQAPNFTLTDLNGQTHTLHDYLGQGKIVVLDFFATWCQPCISSLPGLDDLYHTLGYAGDSSVVLLSIEMDPNTSNEAAFVSQYGVPNPVFDNGHTINADWNIGAFPTFYVICPTDTTWYERVGSISSSMQYITEMFEGCSTTDNDAKLHSAEEIDWDFCPGGAITPKVRLRNIGNNPLTEATVETWMDGMLVNTYNWTGNLNKLDQTTVYLDPVTNINGSYHTVDLVVTDPNGGNDENTLNDTIHGDINVAQTATGNLTLYVRPDNWGTETTWRLYNSSLNTLAAGGPYTDGDTTIRTYNLALTSLDCYNLSFFDNYGDGMCCTEGLGWYALIDDATGDTLASGGEFQRRIVHLFQVTTTSNEALAETAHPQIWPNPSTTGFNVRLELKQPEAVTFTLLDLQGKTLYHEVKSPATSGMIETKVPGNGLPEGIYLLKISTETQSWVEKVTVMN